MLEELRETLCDELEEIAGRGNVSHSDLEDVHLLTDTIKNIDKINRIDNGTSYGRTTRRRYSYGDEMLDRMESMLQDGNMNADEKSTMRKAMAIMRK